MKLHGPLKYVLCVLYSVISAGLLPAQRYAFINYSVREGLAQSQVRCVFEDSRGYLWAGTLGGVSRFNGTTFQNYGREEGLPNNQVSAITELSDGSIAAGSVGGISVISALGVKSYPLPEGYSETTVNTLLVIGDTLWIGTENGLFFGDSQGIRPAALNGLSGGEHIKSLIPSRLDNPALIVARDAVYIWEHGDARKYYQSGDAEVHLFDAEWEQHGELLVAARKAALIRVSTNGIEQSFGESPDIPSTTFTSIMRAGDDGFWLTSRFGFCFFDGRSFQSFTESEGLPTADVRDACLDREGNLWLASYGSGLLRFTGTAIASLTQSDGLPSNAVMSIVRDQAGVMWFATFDQGISRLEQDTVLAVRSGAIDAGSRVWTSSTDRSGRLWFGTSNGLYRYFNGTWWAPPSDSLPDRLVLSLLQTADDKLWIGTASGLAYLERGIIVIPDEDAGYPTTRIRGLAADRSGKIWMASRDGVYSYDGHKFQVYGTEQGLPDLSSYCVAVDDRNRVWVGTQAGLAVLEGGSFRTLKFSRESGAGTINSLCFLNDQVWVGTLNGMYFGNTEVVLGRNPAWQHCGEEEGFSSLETNLNALYIDPAGILWVGTPDGVYRINTKMIPPVSSRPPPLALASMLINLQPPDWSRWNAVPEIRTGLPAGLEVSHRFNHFTFYCDGISLKYPDKVEYQYWLEGLEEDWEPPTNASFVSFSNLPFETFTFHARARVQGGKWGEAVAYTFRIRPPFWLTWWFIALAAAGMGVLIWFIVLNRQRTLQDRREKELSEMKSRMLALEQQSLNSSMNRHFIFNALNSIQYYINRQDRMAANRYLSDFARLIRKNLDSSQTELTTLRDEIERLELYLKLEHMRFRDKFDYEIRVADDLNTDQIKVPGMLLQPFLENSIWHGLLPKEAHGRVEVDIRRNGNQVELKVTDNGIGIDNSLRSKSGTDNHISKGMEITGSRLELIRRMTGQQVELHGPYQLNDDAGRPLGTQVCIRIPEKFRELFEQ